MVGMGGGTGRTVESPFQRDDLTLSAVQEEGVFIHKVDPFTNTHARIPIGMLREQFSQSGNIQVRSLPDVEDPLPLLKKLHKG